MYQSFNTVCVIDRGSTENAPEDITSTTTRLQGTVSTKARQAKCALWKTEASYTRQELIEPSY